MEAQESAFADCTDDEVREAYDHAVGNSMTPQTSPEYRAWWSARADAILKELESREVEA